ncbi:hypothetical protein HBH70_238910 [Parastagonospora nodorum]|nr:hypothetical protein HBH53_033900 [Parastagonospora nodorum]KAH3969368.1 hypothetical protein HBH51_126050 [Parastagonospora nodorum]KAH4025573.1 hypothetical protein HBI09_155180 [Parastagonospora nodorum]KAH4059779.1 hypothetical protein HBH49_022970 [Parastagonospora nodorum]KAH4077237.1 hypothetical protein HBH48_245120 [Parastagonospora nodorum]
MTPAKVMLRKFAESPKAIARFRLVYGSVYSCIHCEPGGATYARHSVGKIGRKTKASWHGTGVVIHNFSEQHAPHPRY